MHRPAEGPEFRTHLERASGDPSRSKKSKVDLSEKIRQRLLDSRSVEQWSEIIYDHLLDGLPRTFNRLMVELCDLNSETCYQTNPDAALWSLLERGKLLRTTEAPLYFFIPYDGWAPCPYCNEQLEHIRYYVFSYPSMNVIGDRFRCVNQDCESQESFCGDFFAERGNELEDGCPSK
jgi:hypothetical protein